MQIRKEVIDGMRDNIKLIGELMGAFNVGERTIHNWFNSRDCRLTTLIALEIIGRHTNLSQNEILESAAA